MKNVSVVITMNSCGELGQNVVDELLKNYCPVEKVDVKFYKFGNNEVNASPAKSVRGREVFIISTGSNFQGTINDNLMAVLSMVRACRDASAKSITVVCAYLAYCRSDKKDQSRMPMMAKLVCDFFKVAGANRIIAVDLHAAQIQAFFDGPFDNLYAINPLINTITQDFEGQQMIIISPDAGGQKRALAWEEKLNTASTFCLKSRDHSSISKIKRHELVNTNIDLTNKIAILVDDIGDTLGTLNSAAELIKEKKPKQIIAVVTHGIFSGNAFENLEKSMIDTIYITNTLPLSSVPNKIKIVDISPLIAQAIKCCINAESIATLFE